MSEFIACVISILVSAVIIHYLFEDGDN